MIDRPCVKHAREHAPPPPPAPLPPPVTSLQTTSRSRRGERGAGAATRGIAAVSVLLAVASVVCAQPSPSYSKEIRPLLAKYCLECHNAKTQKGTLSLETHKAIMEGSDRGPV